MNKASITLGLLCLITGIITLFYAEKLRRNNEIDVINFKIYIGSATLIICGIYLLIDEFF